MKQTITNPKDNKLVYEDLIHLKMKFILRSMNVTKLKSNKLIINKEIKTKKKLVNKN